MTATPQRFAALIHPRERLYFALSAGVSVLAYLLLLTSLVGVALLALAAAAILVAHGLFAGSVKGNGVRVSTRQFPELRRLADDLARQLGLPAPPAVYVVQPGGTVCAAADRLLARSFIVLRADVLDLAYASGEAAVAFVLARELAHLKRQHFETRWLLYPSMLVPFLGTAYARACAYTCDQVGAWLRPDGAADGLRVLAAGRRLYAEVDVDELQDQADEVEDFWTWLAEALSTVPNLPKRIAALPAAARTATAPRPLV